jgi:uncharacterized membrane protein
VEYAYPCARGEADDNMYFSNDQTARLNDLIRKIERRTGVELVAAVAGKSDNYPEIPWKAFALAAAAGALAYGALAVMRPEWNAAWGVLLSLVLVLSSRRWPLICGAENAFTPLKKGFWHWKIR